MPGRDLLSASGEFATGQCFEHKRRDQTIPEQGDFLGLGIHRGNLLSRKRKPDRGPAPGNSCVGTLRRAAALAGAR